MDVDAVLSNSPKITEVYAVLDRHLPLRDCTVEVVTAAVSKSRYFRSASSNPRGMHVFALDSDTPRSVGVRVQFVLTDSGVSVRPAAGWSRKSL
jgi:hypothetical protein